MIVETRVRGRVPVPDGMGLYNKYQQVFCVCACWDRKPGSLRASGTGLKLTSLAKLAYWRAQGPT